jgi:hypothetical protein
MEKQALCPHCHKVKTTVRYRPDAYARDVRDEQGAMMIACDECAQANADDI